MRKATAALAAGILVAAGGLSGGLARASSEERWLHIRVEEHTGKHESVRVNIPLSLVESVAPLLDDVDLGHEGKLRVNDKDLDAVQLRKFLEAVRKSPDAQYVAVESEDEHVDVSKSGDTLYIRVRDDGDEETAEVKLPIAVVDAPSGPRPSGVAPVVRPGGVVVLEGDERRVLADAHGAIDLVIAVGPRGSLPREPSDVARLEASTSPIGASGGSSGSRRFVTRIALETP